MLAYLNSDDVYYEGAVAAAAEALERDPSADVVYGDAVHAGARVSEHLNIREGNVA